MGTIKPGDTISIKNPNRNSLVKAGRLQLRVPETTSAVVPEDISKKDLILLDHLIGWGIIQLEVDITSQPLGSDPLWNSLLQEYKDLSAIEAKAFIRKLSDKRQTMFLEYEKSHKNRKTVLKDFV